MGTNGKLHYNYSSLVKQEGIFLFLAIIYINDVFMTLNDNEELHG